MTTRVFQLIDLDRTLFDTSLFAKLITDEINKTQPGLGDELDAQFEAAYQQEETFFLLRYLRERMGDDVFEAFISDIVTREGSDIFFLPGAKERVIAADHLSPLRPAWGILTYGDEVDQRMKVRILGLQNAPLLITDTADKADVLRAWQNEGGSFTLPENFGSQIVDVLTFEDDKLRAFTALPNYVYGYWITASSDANNRLHEARLEGRVRTCTDLWESTAAITTKIKEIALG